MIICGLFLLLARVYTVQTQGPPTPTSLDLIEINLGNEQEGIEQGWHSVAVPGVAGLVARTDRGSAVPED